MTTSPFTLTASGLAKIAAKTGEAPEQVEAAAREAGYNVPSDSTRALPDLQQTLPGRSRPYRLYTVEHVDYDEFAGQAATVTCTRWSVSYSHTYGRDGWVLNVYDVSGLPEEGVEYHDLNGTEYDEQNEANRAAFNAGVLAFMVYED